MLFPMTPLQVKLAAARERVRSHVRVTDSGKVSIVDNYERTGEEPPASELDALLADIVPEDVVVPDTLDAVDTQPVRTDEDAEVDADFVGPAGDEFIPAEENISDAEIAARVAQAPGKRLSAAEELLLWEKWKASGEDPEVLEPLLKSLRPIMRAKMSPFRGKLRLIPDSALEAEYQLQTVNALRTYKTDKGASLGTYVYRYLDKAHRFVNENQNVGRIPENRVYKIAAFTAAKSKLTEETGKEPSVAELASELKWSKAEADRMDSELRNDLTAQGFESDPFILTQSQSEEIIQMFKYELEGDERRVYELLSGANGMTPETSTGAIARKLKLPDYTVSRIREKIRAKLSRHLNAAQ